MSAMPRLNHWLKSRRQRRADRRRMRETRSRRRRTLFEQLEDRTLLAIVWWDGGAGTSNWDDAANWIDVDGDGLDDLPGLNDDVIINDGDANTTFTVNISGGTHGVNTLDCHEQLDVSGGSVDIADTSEITSLTLRGGTLSGAGDLTITDQFTWEGRPNAPGTMTGTGTTTVAAGATLNLSGTYSRVLDGRRLVIAEATGTAPAAEAIWTGSSNIMLDNGAEFENAGTFDIQSEYTTIQHGGNGAVSTFSNTGTLRKSVGPGWTNFYYMIFNNSGSVEVESGSLSFHLSAGGSSNGTFDVDQGAKLGLVGGPYTVDGTIAGAGTVNFGYPNNTTIAGDYNVTGATTVTGQMYPNLVRFTGSVLSVGESLEITRAEVDFNDANFDPNDPPMIEVDNLHLEGGVLSIAGDLTVRNQFTWEGRSNNPGIMTGTGTTTVAAGATLNLSGTYSRVLDGRRLVIAEATGTAPAAEAIWTGSSNIMLDNGAEFENAGTFDIQSEYTTIQHGGNGAVSTFSNTGTLRKSVGTGWTNISVPFENSGIVDVQIGALYVGSDYRQTAGETILNGGNISGSLDIQGGMLTGAGIISGSVINRGQTVPGLPTETIGTIEVHGDYVQPAIAEAGGPYTVHEGGSVQLAGSASDSSGVLTVEIGLGEFDQLDVVGGVTLGGTLDLSLIGGFEPTVDDEFILVNNDGTDAVVGNFAGLPEGAPLAIGSSHFQISYQGGTDNNDVALTVVSEPTGPPQEDTSQTYEWDFDYDGITFDVDETGRSPIFDAAGLDGPSTRQVGLRVTGPGGLVDTDSAIVQIDNVAPYFEAGPNETLLPPAEGVFSRTIEFTDPGPDVWTGTVNFDDGTGDQTLTIDPLYKTFDLGHPYAAEGTYTVTVTLADDDGGSHTDAFQVEVHLNTSPEAHAGGPYTVVRGGRVRLDASATTDPEQATETLTYDWDFDGDGAFDDATGIAPIFSAAGVETPQARTVGVRVTDNGGLSDVATGTVEIVVVALVPDACDPSKTVLAVGGTGGNDHIVFHPGEGAGEVVVQLNGVSLSTFQPTAGLVAFGQAGNDTIQVSGSIALSAWLYGDDGNDRVKGGAGHDVLFGGLGDDVLVGGTGRDLLVGGVGADRIVGNRDDDILIAGSTAYDANDEAICKIMKEWTFQGRDFGARVANLNGTGTGDRENGEFFLNTSTVSNDGARDLLTGSAGLDWFIFNSDEDKATDLSDEEFADALDFILAEV